MKSLKHKVVTILFLSCSRLKKTRKVQDQQITFEVHQGVVHRQVPVVNNGAKFQLVVPQALIPGFLHYFHENPLGGHLGRLKTLHLEVAWWPTVRKDGKGCDICQKYKHDKTKPSGFLQHIGTQVTNRVTL